MTTEAIKNNLKKLINQTFRLLPAREEGLDWESPLKTIIIEFSGMENTVDNTILFSLLCKLNGLFTLKKEDNYKDFRRTIFECLKLINKLEEKLCQD